MNDLPKNFPLQSRIFICQFSIPADDHNTTVTIETKSSLTHGTSVDDVVGNVGLSRIPDRRTVTGKTHLKFIRDETGR